MLNICEFDFYPLNAFCIYPKGSDGKPDLTKSPDYLKIVGIVPQYNKNGSLYYKVYTLFDKADSFGVSLDKLTFAIENHRVFNLCGVANRDKNYNDIISFSSFSISDKSFDIKVK